MRIWHKVQALARNSCPSNFWKTSRVEEGYQGLYQVAHDRIERLTSLSAAEKALILGETARRLLHLY